MSFTEHLHARADADGSDLLVVDSGDRIEGNGLYDSAHPKGKYILKIFGQQDVDLLCSGNHELYKNISSYDEYRITVPEFDGRYIASNIDIYDDATNKRVPLAQRYKKFQTKNQGIRIVAFGFLFDFNMNSNNTIVQRVEDTIKEEWFQEVIRDKEVDLFLVVGHAPLRTGEFSAIYQAIRDENWDVPIQFLGGHLHIRDFVKYDSKAFGMESGRFMETIGFASIQGLGSSKTDAVEMTSPTFGRRYIDNNLYSFHHHTGLNASTFPTKKGLTVSKEITQDRNLLGLDKVFGCAPKDLWASRAPFPGKDSIFSWLQEDVLPSRVRDKERGDRPRLIISNTGAIRFDIFKGEFTQDSLYIISPFTSGFRYLRDVPFEKAQRLITVLNQAGQIVWGSQSSAFKRPAETIEDSRFESKVAGNLASQAPIQDHGPSDNLQPGYTTADDAGTDGDDTKHSPIPSYRTPNCIEARASFPQGQDTPKTVDVVYVDFIERYILLALAFLGAGTKAEDTAVYMNGTTLTSTISAWVCENWQCNSEL